MSTVEPFRVEIPVRFRDIDALGHVNNAVYLTYLEIARIAFGSAVLGTEGLDDIDFVLARAEVDFRRPVHLGDPLTCGLWIESIGRTSYVFAYEFRVGDAVVARARSVQVFIDRGSGMPRPVPPDFAGRVARHARPADAG